MTAPREVGDARWHVSSYSGSGNNCVEHGRLPDGTQAIRDTKPRTTHPVLLVPPAAWRTFINAVRADDLDA